MKPNLFTSQSLAARITQNASKQTYYTIRLLVDRDLVPDAYRAYAYFRWVDDVLDAPLADCPEPPLRGTIPHKRPFVKLGKANCRVRRRAARRARVHQWANIRYSSWPVRTTTWPARDPGG